METIAKQKQTKINILVKMKKYKRIWKNKNKMKSWERKIWREDKNLLVFLTDSLNKNKRGKCIINLL